MKFSCHFYFTMNSLFGSLTASNRYDSAKDKGVYSVTIIQYKTKLLKTIPYEC